MEEKQEEISNRKPKPVIRENEASIKRWFVTVVVGLLLGTLLSTIIYGIVYAIIWLVPALQAGGSWSDLTELIELYTSFIGMYIGLVIAIRKIAKTSSKAFMLNNGRDEKPHIGKDILPIAGLYLLGLILPSVLTGFAGITYRGLSPEKIIFVIVFNLLFLWMQTGWEELLFRGIPLRILCKNNIRFSTKVFIISIIPSILFMLAHLSNPEVQQYAGIWKILMAFNYFIPAIGMMLCDLFYGSLLPGLVIHWVNNFFAIAFVADAVSVSGDSSIWVNTGTPSSAATFISTFVAYLPVTIYLIVRGKKIQE